MTDEPAKEAATETVDLSPAEALVLAVRLHRVGQFADADRLYRTLLDLDPDNAGATHFLGLSQYQQGERTAGLALVHRSIVLDPAVADWHNNLGNILIEAGRFDEAAAAYNQCIALDPENEAVTVNLGVLYRKLKRYTEAETLLTAALAKYPESVGTYLNLAALYFQQQRFDEASVVCRKVFELRPKWTTARWVIANLYTSVGAIDEAAGIYREWLADEPDNVVVKHHLAACTGSSKPDRASDEYVKTVFDGFAVSFDAKLEQLGYQAPRLVGECIAGLYGDPAKTLRILDAGCGTGLCAPYLAPYAARLVGVDLSEKMLEKAEARGGYQRLVQVDLVQFLRDTGDTWDVIVSADTLCYFGRLDEALGAARTSLKSGGRLVFTVESHEETGNEDYRLHPHGRYSHRGNYLDAVLDGAGFTDRERTGVELRTETGKAVQGWLVAARAAQ